MDTGGGDKKYNQRWKTNTRIPLPLHPLPVLPKHLINKTNVDKKNIARPPLETISQPPNANIASSSSSYVQKILEKPRVEKKRDLNIDEHVTVRQKTDWDFKIFKDESAYSTNDDDSGEKETKVHKLAENKPNKCFVRPKLGVTPAVLREHKGVKKILKRSHNRELQGVWTPGKREKKVEEKVKRRLQFSENLLEKLKSPDHLKKSYMTCLTRDYTTDMFEHLLAVEKKPLDVPAISSTIRACVLNWLMKVHGADGNPAIVQLACWYFDSFLGIAYVPLDKLQLLAVACYWIAQKLENPTTPSAIKLVKISKNAFTTSQLLQTEKTILTSLKFPIRPVVLQEFITYLSWWCDQGHPGEIEAAATFLCMSGMMVDKKLCEEFPSVIAAVSVRTALVLLGKRKMTNKLKSCPVYIAAEKKTSSISLVSFILRRAVRTISDPGYEYKSPLEHYSLPPYKIAKKIITAAAKLAVFDTGFKC